ncbi:MAG: hypothetical protein AAFO91_14500, partial [Bacteroidota bacterium]
GKTSDFLSVTSGVRQGCVLAPSLFDACMDRVMESTVGRGFSRVSFEDERFTDLDSLTMLSSSRRRWGI